MARYIDADALLTDEMTHTLPNGCGRSSGRVVVFADDIENAPAADVVPKKEIANVLCDLKIAVHNKAVHMYAREVPSYIQLKVFDAVIKDYLNKLEKG